MPKMHKLTIDLTGHTYGRLHVVAYAGRWKNRTYWRCKCLACGSVKDYQAGNLRSGHSTQCAYCPARRRERQPRVFKAGHNSWKRMVRTGQVAKRWLSYEKFIADMGEPPKGKRYLMRIDPTKPYKPGNCKWSAVATGRLLTCNGRTMPLSEWAREIGLSRQALYNRLKKMPLHEALTKPVQKY